MARALTSRVASPSRSPSWAALAALALLAIPWAAFLAQSPPPLFTVGDRAALQPLQLAVEAIGEARARSPSPPAAARLRRPKRRLVAYLAAEPGTAVFDGGACEGKAALVLRGRAAGVSAWCSRICASPTSMAPASGSRRATLRSRNSWFRDSQRASRRRGSRRRDPDRAVDLHPARHLRGPGRLRALHLIGDYGPLR